MHLFRPLRDAAYPLLVASQAIPVVVLAPLFVLAFDYGMGPKLAIVALICFFPITVNLLDGLRSVEPELLKLMRSLGASRLRTLRSVELPSALPFLFSGLKVAATVSVIGAVFGEWAGADEGLGRLVLLGNNQLQTPRVYAGVVLLTLMAVALFALVALARARGLSMESKGNTSMRCLAAAALCAALLAVGLRREAGRARTVRLQARRADARLLPERRPRGHLCREGERRLQGGRPRRGDPPAARPGGADQAGGGRARGPGDLVRARGAARPRPGTERGQRRRARAEAAHLDHLAAEGEDPQAGGPRGQDGRHGGNRLPGRVPRDDPARGRRGALPR